MNEKKNVCSVRFDKDLLNDLIYISEKEGYSVSFIVRTITKDYVDNYFARTKDKANNK